MDLVQVIEPAYTDARTQSWWLGGIVAACRPLLDQGHGVVACTFDARNPLAPPRTA